MIYLLLPTLLRRSDRSLRGLDRLQVVRHLLVRGLHLRDDLLQSRNCRLQRFDLPVCGVELRLMVSRQLADGLLQEIDIALQAGGPAVHDLLGRADLDARNILRMKFHRYRDQGCQCRRRQNRDREPWSHRILTWTKPSHQIEQVYRPRDITLIPHSRVVICGRSRRRIGWGTFKGMRRGRAAILGEQRWQHANDDWPSSMARESRRRACRSRYFVKTTAARINCLSLAAISMDAGTITSPAARWKRRWWVGGCRAIDDVGLFQNATTNGWLLRNRTRCERSMPESAIGPRTQLFTTRYRRRLRAAHHIQQDAGRTRIQVETGR